MKTKVIEVKQIKKYFKEIKAVDDISFVVKEGELFAFLGINGAGKSTTINMITGTLTPDEGEILVNGRNVEKESITTKGELGVVFQSSGLDNFLSAYDNLYLRGRLYNIPVKTIKERIQELAKKLEFTEYLKRPLSTLSGGQKRKIDIARALIHHPRIIILDEPTTGLDPQTRKLIWKFLNDLRSKENMTVFLTTHYMEEAAIADYVVIIDEGKIITHGTPNSLKEQFSDDYMKIFKNGLDMNAFADVISENKLKIKEENEYYVIKSESTSKIKDFIVKYPHLFTDFEVYKGDMDDVFLNVTGKNIGD